MSYAKDQHLQSFQHVVEVMERQLRRLHQQLESNEQITAALQHTITQRDREIAELVASKEHEQTSGIQGHIPQATSNLISPNIFH